MSPTKPFKTTQPEHYDILTQSDQHEIKQNK